MFKYNISKINLVKKIQINLVTVPEYFKLNYAQTIQTVKMLEFLF